MTATNRVVAMATRLAGEDEGDGESGKSDDDGNKEGTCEEEGDGEQRQQQDDSGRDNDDAANTMTTTTTTTLTIMMKTTTKTAKTTVRRRQLAVAGGGWLAVGEGNDTYIHICCLLRAIYFPVASARTTHLPHHLPRLISSYLAGDNTSSKKLPATEDSTV